MNFRSSIRLLYQLARLYGVQTVYYGVSHRRQPASVESLLAVLQALGAPVASLGDVPSAWRERQQALWQRPLEPVTVVWDSEPPSVVVRLPSTVADTLWHCHLTLETGEGQQWQWRGADLPLVETAEVEGIQYVVKLLPLPGGLPPGYHRLTLELAGGQAQALIISAPVKAFGSPQEPENRMWGVFLPLYALHTDRSWGSGDFSDLEALVTWVAGMGGGVVGILPLLATSPSEGFEPSPYLPTSRLFWNEFYLDITKVPDLHKCPSAQALIASPSFQEEIKALRNSALVNYRQQMALKRQALEEMCRCFFAEPSERLTAFHRFIEANPAVEDYAGFQATGEKQGVSWRSWPQPCQQGILKAGDYNEDNKRYHLYVQWLAHQQIQAVSDGARDRGLRLYLDLPLGVHPDGYDVWRQRSVFAADVSVGAPVDAVFTTGQNWGFPPLHPEKLREQGYRYFITYLQHHLRHAGILRIDHIMGLHRLFWIQRGAEASQGVYVRYRPEEFYAILALESCRSRVIVVGEDLGTVPPEVRPAMTRHGLYRMSVMQYELAFSHRAPLYPIPPNSVASLNTHDVPPFAAFWQGSDIQQRLELGLLGMTGARRERKTRRDVKKALTTFLQERGWINQPAVDVYGALKACLSFLSASQARVVLVNLEDLWLETQPQNIPATGGKYPNWRRQARYTLDELCQMPQVIAILHLIHHLRRQGKHYRCHREKSPAPGLGGDQYHPR